MEAGEHQHPAATKPVVGQMPSTSGCAAKAVLYEAGKVQAKGRQHERGVVLQAA